MMTAPYTEELLALIVSPFAGAPEVATPISKRAPFVWMLEVAGMMTISPEPATPGTPAASVTVVPRNDGEVPPDAPHVPPAPPDELDQLAALFHEAAAVLDIR
jgi:hypothetical protein